MEESLYLLIPLSVVLVFLIALVFRWSVKSGQFDDLEGPAYRVLMDNDSPETSGDEGEKKKGELSTKQRKSGERDVD